MKHVILLVLASLLFHGVCTSQETTEDIEYYRVLAIKFKFGKADEGTQRGMNLFKKARTMIGLDNMVFRSESGPYDLLVFDPVQKNSPFEDEHTADHFKAMIEIMGSEEALMEEIEGWSQLVEQQEIYYYKKIGLVSGE